jgi:hypothetical protein
MRNRQRLNVKSGMSAKECSFKVIEVFQSFIQQRIIRNLPRNPFYNSVLKFKEGDQQFNRRHLLDYEKIA